jgi:hypothetical protein
MRFAQPIFLWALAGLSIPIAIHLLSRKEGKVIRLGSLRHLQETSTQQFKGIKLNEIVLLILRSLLIILFVSLISGVYWSSQNAKRWLVIENGLEKNPIARKLIDSLTKHGFEQHLLQKGFPEEKRLDNAMMSHWEIISSLEQQELQQAIVLSYSRVADFIGLRKSVSSTVQWITFPSDSSNFIAEVIQQTPERTLIRRGNSSVEQTSFVTEFSNKPIPDSIKPKKMNVIAASIVCSPDFETDKQIVKASLAAIAKALPIEIKVSETTPAKTDIALADLVIWLSEATVSKMDSVMLISYSGKTTNQLLERVAPNHWTINKRLSVDVARQENLTLQLATLLIDEQEKWNSISHHDRRALPDSILFGGRQTDTAKGLAFVPPTNKYILLLFLILLVIERVAAYQRNQ